MTSDSEGPVERLNFRSTFGCIWNALASDVVTFFGPGIFSHPRWRVKSKSRSIDDSSSVSLAEDIAVQAVAELPLLSDELEHRPSTRDSGEPTCCCSIAPSIELHLRLRPFEIGDR